MFFQKMGFFDIGIVINQLFKPRFERPKWESAKPRLIISVITECFHWRSSFDSLVPTLRRGNGAGEAPASRHAGVGMNVKEQYTSIYSSFLRVRWFYAWDGAGRV